MKYIKLRIEFDSISLSLFFFTLILITSCFLIIITTLNKPSVMPKAVNVKPIYGGEDAKPGEFPFFVTVLNYSKFDKIKKKGLCGGSLISSKFILTAAHCVSDLNFDEFQGIYTNPDKIKVLLNPFYGRDMKEEKLLNNPNLVRITKIIPNNLTNVPMKIHGVEILTNQTVINDIALLELEKPVTIKPILLAYSDVIKDQYAIIIGLGTTNILATKIAKNLKKGEVVVNKINKDIITIPYNLGVDSLYFYDKLLFSSYFGNNTNIGSGDSGGPIFIKKDDQFILIGINSFASGAEGYYTNMFYFKNWINLMMYNKININ